MEQVSSKQTPDAAPTHPNCVRVQDALMAAGSAADVVMLGQPAPTAAAAAAQLGVEPAAIANSLIFLSETGSPVLVMASGGHRVDTAKAAAALGVRELRRAGPDEVRSATGQPIGGVAPLGHPHRLPTVVDVALASFDVVWAAGGIPHAVFPTSFTELVALTGGTPAQVA